MPPKNLTPRVPGEALPSTDTTPATAAVTAGDAVAGVTEGQADQLRAELEAIASLNVPEVLEALPTLNREELALLRELEEAGKGRVTVVGPIDERLAELLAADAPVTADAAGGADPAASDPDADWNNPRGNAGGTDKGLAEHAAAAKKRRASAGPVTKADQPAAVLTADGWVVPEPEPKD